MSKEIKFERLKKVQVDVNEAGTSKVIIQVVKWGDNVPGLEKRSYYKDKTDGTFKAGKLKAFTREDFKIMHTHRKEIYKLLKG